MDRPYYEAYDDRYAQVHSRGLRWFMESPTAAVYETLREFDIRKESKILEIGCGEGRDAGPLLRCGYDLTAVDVSQRAVEFCRAALPEFSDKFQRVDCVRGDLEDSFDFIYAVAVVHMLVLDEDRRGFYRFVHDHLTKDGIALICTMGDGETECASDISEAFSLRERTHGPSGETLRLAHTSYRAVSFETFSRELAQAGLQLLRRGFADVRPDYYRMMYAIVKRAAL